MDDIRPGMRVRTADGLAPLHLHISPTSLSVRRAGATGIVLGRLGDHGSILWWVDHGPYAVAAYSASELSPAP